MDRAACEVMIELNARPEPVEVDLSKSAVIVVDMQNAFASKKGMLDLAGRDISDAPRVIKRVKTVVDAARRSNIPAVFLQMGYQPDLSDGGGPGSPNWHKELGIRMMECMPELKGKLVTVGSWDFKIVEELKPSRRIWSLSRPVTAVSLVRHWMTNCANAASAIYSLPASRPMFAWSRRCATLFFSTIGPS